jgi:hypothetical protein
MGAREVALGAEREEGTEAGRELPKLRCCNRTADQNDCSLFRVFQRKNWHLCIFKALSAFMALYFIHEAFIFPA